MAGLQYNPSGVLMFTDGSYLNLGFSITTNQSLSSPNVLYFKSTGGYNPGTQEWTGEKIPLYVCLRDINTNNKLAGFNGSKTDINGYTWNFAIDGVSITKDNNIIYSYTIPSNHNFYTVIYDGHISSVHGYKVASGVLPVYTDLSTRKEFFGVDGLAGGGSAATVYKDYFADVNTFIAHCDGTGIFTNINTSANNEFISANYVLAARITSNQPVPVVASWQFAGTTANIDIMIPDPSSVPDDPYNPGGNTNPGGGNGSFDRSSDPISVPSLPTLSALNTGFISIWRPDNAELQALYNYLWSAAFDLESFKKIFANPIEALMSFGILPFNPTVGGVKSLNIGNISTGIYLTPVTQQYYTFDCGTIYLDNFFNTYLEFEPYSTLEIFLPFCGCMPLSADDFYRRKEEYPGGGKINVKYNIDILSGACVAFLSCYDANGNTTMTYEFNGNMLTQIPLTGNDFSGMYNAVLGIAGNVISGVAHAATGNAAGILGDVVNAAHNVTSAKPSINRSGTIGGGYGLLANRKPFLIRNIPREAVALYQNLYKGYPSHVTKGIASLSDYTEFEVVYLHNVPATDPELKEIEDLLKTGVIL